MTRYDRIAPLVSYGILATLGISGYILGKSDAAIYLTGAMVVMALRNRE